MSPPDYTRRARAELKAVYAVECPDCDGTAVLAHGLECPPYCAEVHLCEDCGHTGWRLPREGDPPELFERSQP